MVLILDILEDAELQDYDSCMNRKAEEILLRPYDHLLLSFGKQFRTKFVEALVYWYPLDNEANRTCKWLVQLIHNFMLLIDDIQDRSVLRRGHPSSYTIYGVSMTLQCANFILFNTAFNGLHDLTKDVCKFSYLPYAMMSLKGQTMDTYWRDNAICPTLEEYKYMIWKKTSVVFLMTSNLIKCLVGSDKDTDHISALFGQYFQIKDDYVNLTSQKLYDEKGFCEDFTEGKFSFPVIYAIRNFPEAEHILDVLKKRTKNMIEKLSCLKTLKDVGSLNVTVDTLNQLKKDIRCKIEELAGNPQLVLLLDADHC